MLSVNKFSYEDFSDYLLHEFGLAINTVKSYESDLKAFLTWFYNQSSKDNLSNLNKKVVYDYLIANLKLYFNKFEDELSASVEEPSNQAYDDAVSAGQDASAAPEEPAADLDIQL